MNCELEEFEQQLKDFLNNPIPEPKFKLWDTVFCGYVNVKSEQGRVFGQYFSPVGIAVQDDTAPGWWYYVQMGLELRITHESNLKAVKKNDRSRLAEDALESDALESNLDNLLGKHGLPDVLYQLVDIVNRQGGSDKDSNTQKALEKVIFHIEKAAEVTD